MSQASNTNPAQEVAVSAGPSVVRIGRHGGRGCGFVLDEGLVVTNAHNLRDRTTEVTFSDGRATQGRAVGIDPDRDLAVLEVGTGDVPALAWAEGAASLGDTVWSVVRIPDGLRVTPGSISSTGRSFRGPRGRRVTDGLEHTAPAAKGSSGSPVVDSEGRLVGITTLRLDDGFSIARPAGDELRILLGQLRSGEVPQRRMLGVALAPGRVSRRLRRSVGLPERDGVLVRHVEEGSPADEAGIREGDLLTEVRGNAIRSVDDVVAAIDGFEGTELPVSLVRATDDVAVTVRFPD